MKIESIINIPKDIQTKNDDEKDQEAFKKLFVENMVKEMLKNTHVIPGTNQVEKDMYMDKMSQLLSDKLIESTDLRWQSLKKINDE